MARTDQQLSSDAGRSGSLNKARESPLPDHHHHIRTHSAASQLRQAAAGAVSGCITRSLTQPFDVLKIRFQLQVEPLCSTHTSKYTSVGQAVRTIFREEGLRAFWKGHNPGQLMSITYGVTQFWSYEQFHLAFSQNSWFAEHDVICDFFSGAMAGCVATCFSMPFDVIRTRLVAQDPGKGYPNSLSAFPTIIRAEGVRGLFRGLATTLIQIGPLVGANFMFYNNLNEFSAQLLRIPNDSNMPTWVHLINGGAAGVASKAIVYPLDFIKKRLQVQGFGENRRTYGKQQVCRTIRQCAIYTKRDEGLRGFYKGMTPTLLKSGLTTALYFSIYDKLKALMDMPLMGKD